MFLIANLAAQTLLSVSTTKVERPTYLSLVGVVWSIGTLLGPVVGGLVPLAY